jgi:hypothetical protein
MSREDNAFDISRSLDPSGDFGRDEGYIGYQLLARTFPDWPVGEMAKNAVGLTMLECKRLDVDLETATAALISKLFRGVPPEIDDYLDDFREED